MESKFQLWVAGDPAYDVHHIGEWEYSLALQKRFKIEKTIKRPGCALNVYMNLLALLQNNERIEAKDATSLDVMAERLVRLHSSNNSIEFWAYAGDSSKRHMTCDPFAMLHGLDCLGIRKYGLILSDYNKGMLNEHNKNSMPDHEFEFTIVDSRYRSLDLKFLEQSKLKIWHATGTEYDPEWAENFDWIIHTDGPDLVRVGQPTRSRELWRSYSVPDTPVIDTTGAGDTFVAALGAFLAKYYRYAKSPMVIHSATQFAIKCCQEVIQQQYSAVTTMKI